MSGDPNNMDLFIKDLERDPLVIKLERKKDMFMLLENAESKIVGFFTPKIIFVKPVLIDINGYEIWELASWNKKELSNFINKAKKIIPKVELLKFINSKTDSIFFPKLIPNLTDKQRRAIELAVENGYYNSPKNIDLRKLAKIMGLSLTTYQQHLKAAEKNIIPQILSNS